MSHVPSVSQGLTTERHLLDLPPALLCAILAQTPSWAARQTCRTLRDLHDDGCTALHLRTYNLLPERRGDVSTLLARLPRLTQLEYHGDDLEVIQAASSTLTALSVTGSQALTSLVCLAAFPQLASLQLRLLSHVLLLGPLTACTSLVSLSLHLFCLKSDVSPLAALSALTSLNLRWFTASDSISAACHPSLHRLDLSGCWKVHDISPLIHCDRLTSLDLSRAPVADIVALRSCRDLLHLRLCNCINLQNIAALEMCPSLVSLDISGCRLVSDISPLAACEQLKELHLSRTAVWDVRPLAGCRRLLSLNIEQCRRDLDTCSVAACTQLTSIMWGVHDETSHAALPQMACGGRIASLWISWFDHNDRNDRPPLLSSCASLTRLTLTQPKEAQWVQETHGSLLAPPVLDGLHACSLLQSLILSGCNLKDLTPIGTLPRLTALDLGQCNKGVDLSRLAGALPRLASLNLVGSPIAAASEQLLSLCVSLTSLKMCQEALEGDLSPLRRCVHLQELHYNRWPRRPLPLLDLSPLSHCTALETLSTALWTIEDLQPLTSCRLLSTLQLYLCYLKGGIGPLAACRRLRRVNLHAEGVLLRDVQTTCPWLDWDREMTADCE